MRWSQVRHKPLRSRFGSRLRSMSEFQGPRVLSGRRLCDWDKTTLARAAMMNECGRAGRA